METGRDSTVSEEVISGCHRNQGFFGALTVSHCCKDTIIGMKPYFRPWMDGYIRSAISQRPPRGYINSHHIHTGDEMVWEGLIPNERHC